MTDTEAYLPRLKAALEKSGPLPPRIANWLSHADEEIAVVTQLLIRAEKTGHLERGVVAEEHLANYIAILGHGRSFRELLEELQRFGIVTRSTTEMDVHNPRWHLGPMFYWMRKHMEATTLLDEDCVPQ